ncbi:MAG: DNA primase [Planctomycetota bacterium]
MSSSFNNDRDRVLAATDILSLIGEVVALRPKGREHVGLCPFHDDRSPSMSVVTHKGTGFYKCFACGAAGNAIDFAINYHRMEFPEALRFLAERANVELTPWEGARNQRKAGEPTRDDVLRANALAEKFFRRVYADAEAGGRARAEAGRRGYDAETAQAFGLGAAPQRMDALVEGVRKAVKSAGADYPAFEAFVQAGVIRPSRSGDYIDLLRDRLVFPIYDELGRPIAFGGRKLDPEQEPKYLNSPESPVFHKSRALYGIHLAKRRIVEQSTAIVTEGYTDVIACHRAGFGNAVATLGTALTREHASVLRRLAERVVLLFDGDEAGQKAADRAVEVFFAETIDIRICVLPDGLDPDDLLRSEGGAERFREALSRSVDALPFMAARIRRQLEGRGLSGRQQMIEQTISKFVDLGFNAMPGLRRQLVLQTLSDLFNLPAGDIDRIAKSIRPRPLPGTDAASIVEPKPGAEPEASATEADQIASPRRARARREAERRLLAVLCAEPGLARTSVPVDGAGNLPLSEAIQPEEFADPAHSAIFAAISSAAESARVLNFDGLLGELADRTLKSLASDLYMFGADVLRDAAGQEGRTATEEVVVSWRDLENLDRRERFRNSGERDEAGASRTLGTDGAVERLARLRERGHDAAAARGLFGRRSSAATERGSGGRD